MSLREIFTTQAWWGKIIGAIMGYLIAGPMGALFGILVGNFFDRGLAEHFAHPLWLYHSESRKTIQKFFFEATFEVMGHIAKSDGRVSENEIKMASVLMKEMKLTNAQKKEARLLFRQGKSQSFNLQKTLSRLKNIVHDNPELIKLFLDIQYRAAQVDGLTTNKLKTLNQMLIYLGFAPIHRQNRFYDDFDYGPSYRQNTKHDHSRYSSRSKNHHKSPPLKDQLTRAYGILEVSRDASKQEVKRAYRKLMSKNHPDKLIAQGLPDEMIKLANDKTQKISKAYDLICEAKGW